MTQEWQDDEEPSERKHKEIIELGIDASVVSRYTAYIVVDVGQNKPMSGSVQGSTNIIAKYIHTLVMQYHVKRMATRQMLQHRGGEPSTNYSKIHA